MALPRLRGGLRSSPRKKGGLASFTTHELEELKKFYNRTPGLSEVLLREAFEAAREKTIPYIAFEIQRLAGRKEN